MNGAPFKSWTDRLLEMAIALVAVGLLLNWAWALIQPLIPVIGDHWGIGCHCVIHCSTESEMVMPRCYRACRMRDAQRPTGDWQQDIPSLDEFSAQFRVMRHPDPTVPIAVVK